jgi:hypothetical protein
MSSQRKIEANRRNAQRSTGPKTPEGKAKVATNSCTHGLCSRNAILPEEDPAEFHALLAGLIEEFQPATALDESHVRELASAEWRLRRIVRLETGIFITTMEKMRERENCPNTARQPARTPEERRYDENTRLLGLSYRLHCSGEAFTKLTRYENSIRRAYYKALKELQSSPPPRKTEMTEQSQTPPPPPDPPLEDTYAQAEPEPPSPWPSAPAARLAPAKPVLACLIEEDIHEAPHPVPFPVAASMLSRPDFRTQ